MIAAARLTAARLTAVPGRGLGESGLAGVTLPAAAAAAGRGRRGSRRPLGRAVGVGRQRRCGRRAAPRQALLRLLLGQAGHFLARREQLEHAPVHLPVPEFPGPPGVLALIDDVQPVAHVVEHQAGLAMERADRPGLPQHVHLGPDDPLAPVPRGGLEAEFLGWRAGGEQDHVRIRGTDPCLVRHTAVGGHQPEAHRAHSPLDGRSQAWPSYRAISSSPAGTIRWISAPTGTGTGSV